MEFFQDLMKQVSFQALVLAHQADDVAETVIKRLFEGAHLPLVGGMEEVSCIEGMKVWRPLLSVSKKSILEWLEKKSLSFFYDKTNADRSFLRARMREEMVPFLSKSFGKEIVGNLYQTSLRLHELREFLDERVEEAFFQRKKGFLGIYFDWNPHLHLHRLEKRHLLKKILQEEKVDLSRQEIELVLDKIEESKENEFSLSAKGKKLILDKGVFFITKKSSIEKNSLEGDLGTEKESGFLLFEGSTIWQGWKIAVEKFSFNENSIKGVVSGWKTLWKGPVSFVVAKGKEDLKLSFAKEGAHYLGRRLCRFWAYHEVPAFLRFSIPVIYKNEEIVGEFISGRNFFLKKEAEDFWKVTIEVSNS
jgi:tRNA(Ile)-lysidine synthase